LLFLKAEIEDNAGYRLFYHEGRPLQRESDLQILFRLTWYASPSDFNGEANNGRGPVDFTASRGSKDKMLDKRRRQEQFAARVKVRPWR
jgi:hypothetical protein